MATSERETSIIRRFGQRGRALLLALAFALLIAGAGGVSHFGASAQGPGPVSAQSTPASGTPAVGAPVGTPNPCDVTMPGADGELYTRTELYFGAPPTDQDWKGFLDREVTPRFPEGLTVVNGYGQYQLADGTISTEDSIVLILFYPVDATGHTSQLIDEIREAYKQQFDQESVLRVDEPSPVCASF